jgi:hypothetical protein
VNSKKIAGEFAPVGMALEGRDLPIEGERLADVFSAIHKIYNARIRLARRRSVRPP